MTLFAQPAVNGKMSVAQARQICLDYTHSSKQYNSGDTDRKNAASGTMSGIESSLSAVPAAIADGVTTQANSISSAASGFASKVSGFLSDGIGTINTAAGDLKDSVTQTMAALDTGLSDAFSGSTSSAFTDKTKNNSVAGNSKTGVPDPVKSSFAKATPRADLVKTTSATTGLAPHTVTKQKTTTSDKGILGSLPVLVKKYGTDIIGSGVSTVRGYVNGVVKSEAVQGLYSGIKSTYTTAMSVKNSITGTISEVEGTVSGIVQGSMTEYHKLVGGLASTLTGSALGIDSLFDTSLPSVTDANGNAIAGVPTGSDPATMANIFSAAKSLGCNIENAKYTAYGAQQSAYGALLGISAQTDMTSILQNLMNCNRFDGYGINIAQSLFYSKSGTSIGTANTLLQKIGGSSIAVTPSLTKGMVTNQNLTTADIGDLKSALSTLGEAAENPFKTGTTIAGNDVWDIGTLSNSLSSVKTSLLSGANKSLSAMTGGFLAFG